MSGVYTGDFTVKQWIEPLISSSLVGGEHCRSDVSNNTTTMTPSSLVQVVSIGRPTLRKTCPIPMRRSTMPLSTEIPSIDTVKKEDAAASSKSDSNTSNGSTTGTGLLRSTSFNNVQQLLKPADDGSVTMPTSLLVSDGSTTVLAVLSRKTRSSLSILASDNSLDSYQNNTITRGCVLKISEWRVDTLASAVRAEEAYQSREDDNKAASDIEPEDKCSSSLSTMDYRNDPLLRDHQSLSHHRYYDRQPQRHLSPDKVVVLYVLGPIEIMGGHGMSALGRPKYIMETIDVLRTINESNGSQISARIHGAMIGIKRNFNEVDDGITRPIDGHDMVHQQSNGATIVTPALHRRTVSSGLDKPHNVTRDVSGDSIPLGDVAQLFDSPKRSKLNAIWETFASASPSLRNSSADDTNKNLIEMIGAISNDDSSSNTDFPIGVIDPSADPMELKRLFGKIIGKGIREDALGNSRPEDGDVMDRFATQVVEEVMSDEYSHSDVSCDDDDDDSRLGINNMLLSQDNATDQPKHPVEIAIAVANESLSDEMEAQKPYIRQQKHLRIKPVVVKQNPQISEEECENDVEDSCEQQQDEDLLDTQPIHPVNLPDQGNVIDDDVSIDDDEDNMLSDVVQGDNGIDSDIKGTGDDIQEFHDAVCNEDDLPNDDEEGSYTPVETLHDIEGRLDKNDVHLSLDINLLRTQAEILPVNYNEISPIDSDEPLWSKSFGQSDVELTYDRWMRSALDGASNQNETSGLEYCVNGDSLRKYLCKPLNHG
jgi:hypothetical protein